MLGNCEHILNNQERLQALEATGLIEAPPDEAFQRLNLLAAKMLNAPISIFSVIGKDRQYFKSVVGLPQDMGPGTSFPIDTSVCQYALAGEPLQFEDTKNHPAFKDNQPVQMLNISGYLGMPVITKEGHSLGTVCVFDHQKRHWTEEDMASLKIITNSFLTEIELRTALKKSKDEVARREEFMSIASHEMKTPLTSMKLQVEIARKRLSKGAFAPDHLDKLLDQLDRQFKRLQVLVEDMFDVSRITTGKFTIKPENCNLNELTQDILQSFSSQFQEAGCEVSFKSCGEYTGKWDSYRLEQVISNIFSNSIKYAPGAPVSVAVKEEDEFIHLSISDQGPGLSQEAQDKIFQPFERILNNSGVTGLGLGLYISLQIMKAHGGDLTVESSPGKGSTFNLLLPR